MTSAPYIMALDVGQHSVKAGLVDREGRVNHYYSVQSPAFGDTSPVGKLIADACRQVLGRAGLSPRDCAAVGCCTPGSVDPDSGVIVASATPGWVGVDFRGPLEEFLGRAVTVESDGAAAAQAAYTFGPARGKDNLLVVTVGLGISCGLITGGEVLRGHGKAALEAGHLPLFARGRPCSCGLRGCWEAHAGGGALWRTLSEYRAAGQAVPASAEELARAAAEGNQLALSLWDEQATLLGLGLAALLNVLNPRTVVLGGGMMKSWALIRKRLLKTARAYALSWNSRAAIVCAPDPERLSLLGAAVAAARREGLAHFFNDWPWNN